MNAKKREEVFEKFIETYPLKNMYIYKLDLITLSKFNVDVAKRLLDAPEENIQLFNIALKEKNNLEVLPYFWVDNIPDSEAVTINEIRHVNQEKLVKVKGMITSKSPVYQKATSILFKCPDCGKDMNVPQKENKYITPNNCMCGRKGRFIESDREMLDVFDLELEELTENLKGTETPQKLICTVSGFLAEKHYKKIQLGNTVELIGILKIKMKIIDRRKTNLYYSLLEINSYKNLDYKDLEMNVSKKEKELFKQIKFSSNPAKYIADILFSDIYGYQKEKEAVVIQLFSGGLAGDGTRDTINILLVGDPGTAKTDIARRCAEVSPIGQFVSIVNSSGVGITASVEQDKTTGRWMARAGVIPRCNGGLVALDEIDKTSPEDRNQLTNAMEQGFFVVNKAGISAKMLTKTCILATSNPKSDDWMEKIGQKTVGIERHLLDRFDLVFPFKDIIDPVSDAKIATSIVQRHTSEVEKNTFGENKNTFPSISMYKLCIKKYIYNSKVKCVYIKLSKRVCVIISRWYAEIRKGANDVTFQGKRPTPRMIEGILRFARAITRMKQKDTVTIKELRMAIDYYEYVYGVNLTQEVKVE